ncbi:permease [Listeria ivanovii]|uniref:Putative YcgR protein n=1 Tax=Listeria ivanovii (strain ATCC BAA-678 / PAM 55) TaxID=881621 RepID=G2ZDS5_LISIP|nr:permease [Listeria ivanovii]AHI55418.1 membrane protein [Listeria ivanovii WSLC3009]AIS64877.1 membrane protein [Listeria ivanovii subsp. ivanovii]MBC1758411.1 permease [Listeria ivanovii]MBK3913287.1 permease [Listeria ivanovii subsp. ivanovii]MBK3920596.1 permease [Listeria ivanovii subsp. ivanovii]
MFSHLPDSFLQMNTIFISILIEALPFVLIGVFIAGFIQMFISEKFIARVIPKNKFLAVIVGSLIGVFFPSCECGIVPIVRNLLAKGVPLHAGIAFMLTAPIINPVVLFSTYVAFGSTWEVPLLRVAGSLVVALVVGNIIAYFYKGTGLKDRFLKYEAAGEKVVVPAANLATVGPNNGMVTSHFQVLEAETEANHNHHHHGEAHVHMEMSLSQKVWHTVQHAVDEFFSVGKYLVFGALLAAAMQTYIKTSTLVSIGHGPVLSILLMMVLAFVLSLCSEADAFIAASFRSVFSTQSIVAFLVFGPMLDIKNLMMMLGSFKAKFVLLIVTSVTIVVFLYALVI